MERMKTWMHNTLFYCIQYMTVPNTMQWNFIPSKRLVLNA